MRSPIDNIAHHLIHSSVANARRVQDPFCHLLMESVFPREAYQAMLAQLPDTEFYQELKHPEAKLPDGRYARLQFGFSRGELDRLPQAGRTFWQEVAAVLRSDGFKNSLVQALEPGLSFRFGAAWRTLNIAPRVSLMRDIAGYGIGIHHDIFEKVITAQFYLPRDGSLAAHGTVFHTRTGKSFQRAKKLEFLPNTGYAFAVHSESWHSVDRVMEPVTRDSLMVIYYLAKA
jgi:hypothetical protein